MTTSLFSTSISLFDGAAKRRLSVIVAIGLSLMISFTGIFDHELIASDEIRVGEIGREILMSGNVLVPTLGGEAFMEHPPLYYWLISVAFRGFGVSDGVARFPSAIAGFLTLLLAFDLSRRLAGPGSGVMTVLVLSTMWGFFRHAHRCMVDPLLSLFVMLGYWAFVLAMFWEKPQNGHPTRLPFSALVFVIYLAGALAFLTKGPVGVILLGSPLALAIIFWGRWDFLRSWAHLPGILILITGCLIWPILLYLYEGENLFKEFVVHNILYRIFPDPEQYTGGHVKPFWYYFPKLFNQIGPWLLTLPAAYYWAFRDKMPEGLNYSGLRFISIVFPLGLLLLSLPGTKREVYLMPLLAPLAVFIGIWATSMAIHDTPSRISRMTTNLFGTVSAILPALIALIIRLFALLLAPLGFLSPRTDRKFALAGLPGTLQHWSAVVFSFANSWRTRARAIPVFAGLMFTIMLMINLFAWPALGSGRFLRPITVDLAAMDALPPRLVGYKLHEEMRGALPFYTGLIAQNLQSPEEVSRYAQENPMGLLLLGKYPPSPLSDDLAATLREIKVWEMAEGRYVLYDFLPEPRQPIGVAQPH
ncbi:MAG: glycosyltransferase family 39 protein [Nitrospirales bacterium]|nr:glycosyltransferase family 39 protein [Nitrospirales bacterium]MDR4482080.1 glycosyltransferase family 39 protein [Nitrospirales bacterium]